MLIKCVGKKRWSSETVNLLPLVVFDQSLNYFCKRGLNVRFNSYIKFIIGAARFDHIFGYNQ